MLADQLNPQPHNARSISARTRLIEVNLVFNSFPVQYTTILYGVVCS
jgi:hypothetical protein